MHVFDHLPATGAQPSGPLPKRSGADSRFFPNQSIDERLKAALRYKETRLMIQSIGNAKNSEAQVCYSLFINSPNFPCAGFFFLCTLLAFLFSLVPLCACISMCEFSRFCLQYYYTGLLCCSRLQLEHLAKASGHVLVELEQHLAETGQELPKAGLTMAADDLLPVFQFCVIHSGLTQLVSRIAMMNDVIRKS